MLVGLFGYMLCSSGEEGGCEWSVGCASPIHHESRPSPPNIHQHPDLPPVRELGKGERGAPRVRMGRKRERECSPWKKGENECAMSAPRNQDRMVPPSNATPTGEDPKEAESRYRRSPPTPVCREEVGLTSWLGKPLHQPARMHSSSESYRVSGGVDSLD